VVDVNIVVLLSVSAHPAVPLFLAVRVPRDFVVDEAMAVVLGLMPSEAASVARRMRMFRPFPRPRIRTPRLRLRHPMAGFFRSDLGSVDGVARGMA